MGLVEVFEIGFFEAFLDWGVPEHTILLFVCLFSGCVIQLILQKKCKKTVFRLFLPGLCVAGLLICECVWHAVTGWDRLGIDIIYGFIVTVLLGVVFAVVISFTVNKWMHSTSNKE